MLNNVCMYIILQGRFNNQVYSTKQSSWDNIILLYIARIIEQIDHVMNNNDDYDENDTLMVIVKGYYVPKAAN